MWSKNTNFSQSFGGGSVLELARHNDPRVLGVISLHGSLSSKQPVAEGEKLTAQVAILHFLWGKGDAFRRILLISFFKTHVAISGSSPSRS